LGEAAAGKVGAIIVAAGSSRRMGNIDKIFAEVGGTPILARSVDVFNRCSFVHEIAIVLSEFNIDRGRRLLEERGWSKVVAVCLGGERRQDSVREGLKRLAGCQWVVIHDGARPFVSADLIERGLAEAQESGAAVCAVPVTDTIKVVGIDNHILETPARESLWMVQTPQVFRFDIIERAHRQAEEEVTDDATLVERLGCKVKVYMGSYDNMKVTTPQDLALAEMLLKEREQR
jgi:2-C-methyl-D-erythritol 4-phosphate cytidylyltransferase